MDKFYTFALLFALVFLIVCLILVGLMMQNQSSGKKFPLRPTVCPDKWRAETDSNNIATKCIFNIQNKGKETNTNENLILSTVPNICDKKKWTISTGVRWDGVSNYTGCS